MSVVADSNPATDLDGARSCGSCSLCCTVLRVDELGKLGGSRCVHQRVDDPNGGCGIHASRPSICRGYRCLWLSGSLETTDRPDLLGAFLSLTTEGETQMLSIHEAGTGAFEASPRLQEIAAGFRAAVPVRVSDAEAVMDPDRGYRLLLPNGEDHLVAGDRTLVRRAGLPDEERRMPWLDRRLRRLVIAARRRYLGWMTARGRAKMHSGS